MAYNHIMVKTQFIQSVILIGILTYPFFSSAQQYQWTDKNGTVHFTDDPERIPPAHRKRNLPPTPKQSPAGSTSSRRSKVHAEIPGSEEKLPPQGSPISSEEKSPSGQPQEKNDTLTLESGKKAWRAELIRARKELAEIEQECKNHTRQRDINQQKSLLYARPIDRQKTRDAGIALQDCRKKLVRARRYLKTDLPEKARKANVPPGWLR